MKVFFACGGTGGHIFPAFSVAEELRARDPSLEIIYICGKKDIENAIFKLLRGERVVSIESAPFQGALSLLNPIFLIKLISGFGQSFVFLNREKPDLVVGFGGYFSFPVVLTARGMRIKTLVHEQNVVPGVANRWLARLVDAVALSFPETKNYLPVRKRQRVTGNPIRASIEKDLRQESLRFFNFEGVKTTLLVLGGSQGSESINQFFLEALRLLPERFFAKIQVLHLCGKMPVESAERAFKELKVEGRAYSFFEKMHLAYGAADLALGRAGATFLAEIGAKDIPAILVPYPYGSGHQRVNAQIHSRLHHSVVIEQKDLSAEKLAAVFNECVGRIEEKKRSKAASPAPQHSVSARASLADFIEELLRES